MDFKALVRAQAPNQGVITPDQKAITPHPILLEGPTPPLVVNGPHIKRGTFSQKEASRHLNAYGGKEDAIDWVMACVKLIIETSSNAEWGFQQHGKELVKHRTPDTPAGSEEAPFMLTKLFEEPNPYMDYTELIELTLIDYILVGNAYWYKWRTNDAGQPLALYRLAPPFVSAVPGPWGIEGYKYKVPGMGEMDIPTDQIIHFRQANPHSPYFGLGLVQGAARMLDLELALTDTQATYYEKRAQPSMVVQSDRRISKDVFKRLQGQLRTMYGGPRNAGALMVLEAGLKYESISPSAHDAAFEQMTKLSRDRILAMFRVSALLLGINDTGAASGSASNDQRIFDTKTMRPLLNKFEKAISRALTQPGWGVDFKVEYDYIMPPEDRIRLAGSFASLPGVRVREVRDYAGLQPLGTAIDEVVLNLPGDNGTADNTRNGHPDYNLPGEGGRPPNAENTLAFPADIPKRISLAVADNKKAMTVDQVLARLDALTEIKALMPATNSATFTPPSDVLLNDREAAVDGIVATATQELRAAARVLEHELLSDLNSAVEGKAPGSRLRSKIRQSPAWTTFKDSIAAILEKATKAALSTSVMQQGRLGRRTDENIDYDLLAREIVYRSEGVKAITATLRDSIAKKIAADIKDGTKADLEAIIRQEIDSWYESKSETIALTEATHAFNEGTLAVAELTGSTHVFVHDGEDHDEPCVKANGQIWDIKKARENRLQHPRCRRAFTIMTAEDVNL